MPRRGPLIDAEVRLRWANEELAEVKDKFETVRRFIRDTDQLEAFSRWYLKEIGVEQDPTKRATNITENITEAS